MLAKEVKGAKVVEFDNIGEAFIEISQGNLRFQSREELRMREAHELKY